MSTIQNNFSGVETNQDLPSIDANLLFSGTCGDDLENAFSNHAQASGPAEHDNAAEVMFKTQQCRTYTTKGKCPYEYMCMYAHGRDELRTKEMNIRDGLTTAAQVRTYQRKLKATGYSTRDMKGPSSPGFGSPTTVFGNGSYPASPFGIGSSPAFSPGGSVPTTPMSPSRMNSMATSPLAGSAGPFPWMKQPTMSSHPMHMKGCDCRECRMATAQAAQAQALACPCVDCLAAAAAAVAAVTACRIVTARKAQEQAQLCPCPECIGAAQAALASQLHPCPCPDCATRGCNDGSSMGAPTTGASTPVPSSHVSRLTSRDFMANH